MRLILISTLLLLGACTTSPTVSNDILAAKVGLTASFKAATLYERLPRCPGPVLCSEQAVVDRIKALATQAHDAVALADANAAMISAAILAITNFNDAIPSQGGTP